MAWDRSGAAARSAVACWAVVALAAAFAVLSSPTRADGTPTYPLLHERIDPALHRVLKRHIDHEFGDTRSQQVPRKKVGIVVADITDLQHPRVAEVNGDVTLYAASLPKIAILLGAYVQVERGELVLDDDLRAAMTRMIRNSSNADATLVLNRVGFSTLAGILQSERYRLYDPERGGGLWVGRDYGGGQVWRRDPLNGISHAASAMQVARFYYLLMTDRLSTPEHSREMRDILSDPALRHKFVKGLEKANPGARIARKSGTWRDFHADGGVVETDRHRYIIVVIGEHPEGGRDLERIIAAVEAAFAEEGAGKP